MAESSEGRRTGKDGDGAAPAAAAQIALEDAVRRHQRLQGVVVDVLGSTAGHAGVVVHLRSAHGQHDVALQRADWAQLPPEQVADFVVQKVLNEIRWRRTR